MVRDILTSTGECNWTAEQIATENVTAAAVEARSLLTVAAALSIRPG